MLVASLIGTPVLKVTPPPFPPWSMFVGVFSPIHSDHITTACCPVSHSLNLRLCSQTSLTVWQCDCCPAKMKP